jgi:hypothetical protein
MSVRRSALVELGGFCPSLGRNGRSLISNEEQDLFDRLRERGARVVYEPAALVLHRVLADRISWRWVLRRGWAQGRGNARVRARRHAIAGRELAAVCRGEMRHVAQGFGGVLGSAARRDTSAVLDEIARRSGHVSGAIEQMWLCARAGRSGNGDGAESPSDDPNPSAASVPS